MIFVASTQIILWYAVHGPLNVAFLFWNLFDQPFLLPCLCSVRFFEYLFLVRLIHRVIGPSVIFFQSSLFMENFEYVWTYLLYMYIVLEHVLIHQQAPSVVVSRNILFLVRAARAVGISSSFPFRVACNHPLERKLN